MKMFVRGFAPVAVAAIVLAASAQAAVKLPAVIGDNMVLQRNQPVPVWGWDAPGTEVTVTLGEAISRKGPEAAAEMLVYLGRNPDVAASLHGLDRYDLAERVAEIRADMRSAKAEPKRSNAPTPLQPVRAVSGAPTPAPGSEGYIPWKLKQLRK